jgi:hypothetical protein
MSEIPIIPRDILGRPEEGVHSYTLFGFAAFDVIGTILIAILIAVFKKLAFVPVLLVLLILGEILHAAIGVDTRFLRLFRAS